MICSGVSHACGRAGKLSDVHGRAAGLDSRVCGPSPVHPAELGGAAERAHPDHELARLVARGHVGARRRHCDGGHRVLVASEELNLRRVGDVLDDDRPTVGVDDPLALRVRLDHAGIAARNRGEAGVDGLEGHAVRVRVIERARVKACREGG